MEPSCWLLPRGPVCPWLRKAATCKVKGDFPSPHLPGLGPLLSSPPQAASSSALHSQPPSSSYSLFFFF